MSRPFQVGDFILISFSHDNNKYYKSLSIVNNEIYFSPIDDPDAISKLIYDINSGKWKIYGTTQEYRIEFISKEQYELDNEKLDNKELMLLSLPNDNIFEIGLSTPLEDLTKLCQSNSKLNTILCGNEMFWKARYLQDFGMPMTLTPISSKSWRRS